jgi:hypothetical protein
MVSILLDPHRKTLSQLIDFFSLAGAENGDIPRKLCVFIFVGICPRVY